MKAIHIFLMNFIFASSVYANGTCQSYRITEKSNLRVVLSNTAHDRLGWNDEIIIEASTSTRKLDETRMFSDFFGSVTYKQNPNQRLGITKVEAGFNKNAIIFDQEIDHEKLYNQYLNLLVVDEDIAVPLASGSLEIPFYLLSGGNHDDLIFSLSKRLPLNNIHGLQFQAKNVKGDAVKILITPANTIVQTKEQIEQRILELKTELSSVREDNIRATKRSHDVLLKIIYLQDVLSGKIQGTCVL